MTAAITSNLEIEAGSDTLKLFSVKDPTTGLPQDLTGAVVEVQINFESLPAPIVFRSDVTPNVVLGGLLGTIRLVVPWLDTFNTSLGIGAYSLYIRYPDGFNMLQFKGFVTIVRGNSDVTIPGTSIPDNPLPGAIIKGVQPASDSTSVVLAYDQPVISVSSVGGLGMLEFVQVGALGVMPDKAVGVRMYLGMGDSVSFTIADAAPTAPSCVFTLTPDTTGPNWDENLSSGQMMYVTEISGAPKFRWI